MRREALMSAMRRGALLLALAAAPAVAQEAAEVRASAPVARSVTLYRAPWRNGGAITLGALGGFAVITETREVDLPAGPAQLRFEGVVDGIVPESAVIAGLPGTVIEKNQDNALISPAALLRATVGRDVMLTRTDRHSGKVSQVPARLISASEQGVVFATAAGTEALACAGLAEGFRYAVATREGLAAQPTLSVLARSGSARHATVRLTYIAENFDWNASYVARISPDGTRFDLAGWVTLANGNSVSLPGAETQIVAGGLNRAYVRRYINDRPRVVARCWPLANTSAIPERGRPPYRLVQPWMGVVAEAEYADQIIVTAAKRTRSLAYNASPVAAPPPPPPPPPPPEQLGDLKLYRLPQPTTIAARQLKQALLIEQGAVPFTRLYRAELSLHPWMSGTARATARTMLRTFNDKQHHLGVPLPAGTVTVEQGQRGEVLLLGEPSLGDKAEGEKLELELGEAPDVTASVLRLPDGNGQPADQARHQHPFKVRLSLANAAPHPTPVELHLPLANGWHLDHASIALAPRIDGVPTVKRTLAPGERQELTVTVAPD